MTSSYNDIYSRFLNKIRDYEFAGLPEPNAMIVEWISPKVKTTTLLNQMFTNSKESKWYNQRDHLAELQNIQGDAENKVREMLRDKGYIYNSYLGNG